jgi:hypothetical protein
MWDSMVSNSIFVFNPNLVTTYPEHVTTEPEPTQGIPESLGSPGTKALAALVAAIPEALTIMPLEIAKVMLQLDAGNRCSHSQQALPAVLIQSINTRPPVYSTMMHRQFTTLLICV